MMNTVKFCILFIIYLFSDTFCEKRFNSYRVEEGQHPYVAAFAFQEIAFRVILPVCGGAIINEKHVLTASHCLDVRKEKHQGRFVIMVGSIYSLVNEGTWYQIEGYFTTENQQLLGAPVDDIALIRIYGTFDFDEYIQPIPISSSSIVPIGKKATVFGWGQYVQKPVKDTSSRLLAVEMEIVIGDKCYYLWDTFDPLYNICAEPPLRTGTCEGDSGGPLVIDDVLYGLLSYGHVVCGNGAPEVYVNVGVFYDWIQKQMLNDL